MSSRGLRRLVILLVVLVVTAGAGFALVQVRDAGRRASALEAKEAGDAAFEEERWRDALSGMAAYLSYDEFKGDAQAVYRLAEARSRVPEDRTSRHKLDALSLANQAVRLAPDSLDARLLLMRLNVDPAIRRLPEALEASAEVLRIDPDNEEAVLTRIALLGAFDRHEEAVDLAESYAEGMPGDFRAELMKLQAMRSAGATNEDVLAEATGLIDAYPDEPGYLVLATDLLLRTGDTAGARAMAIRANDAGITSPATLRAHTENLDALGLRAEADRLLEDMVEQGGSDWEFAIAYADRAWLSGRPQEALDRLRPHTSALIEADDGVLGFAAFIEHVALDDDADRPLLTALRERGSSAAQSWASLCEAADALEEDDAARARDLLEGLLLTIPGEALPAAMLARAYAKQGEALNAIDLYEQALSRSPRWVGPRLELVEVLINHGSPSLARQNAAIGYRFAPESVAAREALLEASTVAYEAEPDQGATWRAALMEDLGRLADEIPDFRGRALGRLARIAIADGDAAQAEALISDLFASEPSIPTGEMARLVAAAEGAQLTAARRLRGLTPIGELQAALAEAEAGRADAGKVRLREAISGAEGVERLRAELRLAVYLDEIDDPEARDELLKLSRAYPDNAGLQADILRTRSIWNDQDTCGEVINRLRELTGDGALNWRTFAARRVLAFDRTEQAAAEALTLLDPVLRSGNDNTDALVLAADASGLSGLREKKIEYLEAALRTAPDRSDLARILADALSEAGQSEESTAVLLQGLGDQDLAAPDRRRLIERLLARGLVAEARGELELLAGDDARDRALSAMVAAMSGDVPGARASFITLLDAQDAPATVLMDAAEFFVQIGERQLFTRAIERAMPDASEAERLRVGTGIAVSVNAWASAEASARRLVDMGETEPTELGVLIAAALSRGDLEGAEASASLGAVTDIHSRAVSLAREAAGSGRLDAIRSIGRLLADPSERAQALFGALERHLTSPDRTSLDGLRGFTEDHPTWSLSWLTLATELVAAGDANEAVRVLVNASDRVPNEAVIPATGWELAAGLGEWGQAERFARTWRTRSALDPHGANMALATSLARRGDLAGAEQILSASRDRIIAEANARPRDLVTYAEVLVSLGRLAEGEALLRPRLDEAEGWVASYTQLGLRLPALEERRAFLRRAIEVVADKPAGIAIIGQAWLEDAEATGEAASAETARDTLRLVAREPRFAAAAWGMIARSEELLDNQDAAIEAYRTAVELSPDNVLALNNLAYMMLSDESNDGVEAAGYARRAVELLRRGGSSGDVVAQALDTLADAERRQGRFEEAAAASAEAIELGLGLAIGSRAGILLDLAEAQVELGQQSQAARTLERAETLVGAEPDPERVRRLSELKARNSS
ncbi:MAG: hypothetical protein AAGB51_00740 [Planctomycetota bacterium]